MIACPWCQYTHPNLLTASHCLQCKQSFAGLYLCMDQHCSMHRVYQGANRECQVCNRRLLGEFSGRDINWGNVIYRIREFLGGGGMGEVYRAIEQDNAGTFSRECAVKFNKNMMDPEIVERFKREVKVLNMLQNPHNIRVYNYGELYEERAAGMEVRAQFMVMELLTGQDLNEIVKQGKLSPREGIPIFVQVCSALAEAHQKGIIHRDLKPHNIMLQSVTGDQFAKVFDFGLSRIDSMNDNLSTTGVVMGTFRYMSPEQALNEDMDHRTDIFSLGVVLYEVLTGTHPFPAKNLFELFTLHQQGPPPPEGLQPDLVAIINKSLAYEKDRRYQTTEELRGDLMLWLGDSISGRSIHTSQLLALRELEHSNAPSPSEQAGAVATEPGESSRQGLWIGIMAMLVVAVGLGGFFFLQPPKAALKNNSVALRKNSVPVPLRRATLPRKTSQPKPQTRKPALPRRPVARTIQRPTRRRRKLTRSQRRRIRRLRQRRAKARRRKQQEAKNKQKQAQQAKAKAAKRAQQFKAKASAKALRKAKAQQRSKALLKAKAQRRAKALAQRKAKKARRVALARACPRRSPPIRYGQLDRALGRSLNTRISRYINRAAKETIYDAGLRLSQSWKRSPVICKKKNMRSRILRIVQRYCRRYKPSSSCRSRYRAAQLSRGGRMVYICQK